MDNVQTEADFEYERLNSLNMHTPYDMLISLGFSPNELGFAYLAYGISISYLNYDMLYSRKLDVLTAITHEFQITKARAVDNMQRSIFNAWNGIHGNELRNLFPATEFIMPKPSDFIYCIAILIAESKNSQASDSASYI